MGPVWGTPERHVNIHPHYYVPNISIARQCELHNWKGRVEPRRVFDAVLISNELDLLEIRFQELGSYVLRFIVLESDVDHTFTGRKKPLLFSENPQRFDFVKDKVDSGRVEGRELLPGEDPFNLDRIIAYSGIADNDLLIMSDVDEIPSGHTIDLLRWCDGWQSPAVEEFHLLF